MFIFENLSIFDFIILFVFISFLYRYNDSLKNFSNKIRYSLFFIRFLIVALFLIIVINPSFLKKHIIEEKLKISFLIDNSKSMSHHLDLNTFKKMINNEIENLDKKNIINDTYIYGDNFKKITDINLIDFSDSVTNFNKLLTEINDLDYDNFILISDGQNNYGEINSKNKSKSNIFSFGVGGKYVNKQIDAKIDTIYKTYIGNDSINFKINIEVLNIFDEYINLYLNNKNVSKKNLLKYKTSNENNSYIYQFSIHKDSLSRNNLFNIDTFDKEDNKDNNYYSYKLDEDSINKKNILLISGLLSPNTNFLKNKILENNIFEILHIDNFNDDYELLKDIDKKSYDGIILDNFPININQVKFLNSNKGFFKNNIVFAKGPSEKKYYAYYNKFLKDFGYSIINNNKYSENFYYSNKDSRMQALVKNLIPYRYNFKIYNNNGKSIIQDMNNSTILDYNNNNLFIFIPNLSELSNRSNNIYNNDYYQKIINYFLEKIFFGNSLNQIRIYSNKNQYIVDENFKIFIDIFNAEVEKEEIKLSLYNNKGEFISEFNKLDYINNDLISVDLNIKKTGKYSLQVQSLNKESISNISNTLNIKIQNINLESENTYLNSAFLKKISNNSNGEYFMIDNLGNYIEKIQNSGNFVTKFNKSKFFDFQIFWLIILILLFIEWIIRKNKGML